ncbi:hypothetical protein KP509_15G065500 [Ceratopteris richardii]|uniref:Uncharacterized protein n=1 Tax=Ceratopteris richardii TaxID=49495 RepID=A0A8T2TAM8_CERRI|nr:hypothetical protein KP509_15G065500 [Ceratopteris richardii]
MTHSSFPSRVLHASSGTFELSQSSSAVRPGSVKFWKSYRSHLKERRKVQLHCSSVQTAPKTCNTALAAKCSTEQQTVQNPVSVKTPVQARQKEILPKLDDGGSGGGPGRDDGGGGGGGGGGGWAGGFFLWGFLLLLSFVKEKEKDKVYRRPTSRR